MSRILAIDYGKKRTGVAWTDPLQIIATALGSFDTRELIIKLQQWIKDGPVSCIVLGYPRRWNLEDSHITQEVLEYKVKLQKLFPLLEVVLFDERFTSSIAQKAIQQGGLKKKDREDKHLVNTLSAVIILQDYLQTRT